MLFLPESPHEKTASFRLRVPLYSERPVPLNKNTTVEERHERWGRRGESCSLKETGETYQLNARCIPRLDPGSIKKEMFLSPGSCGSVD